MMLSENDILGTLDTIYQQSDYCSFPQLGHVYSNLIDCRLNVFRSKDGGQWAIAIERLGYSPRGGQIELEIFYFGNCIMDPEYCNDQPTNSYSVFPIDPESFHRTIDGESLRPDADHWIVRTEELPLSHRKEDYILAGIELKEYEPGEIGVEEAARLLVSQNSEVFCATDPELYKSIPSHLEKIMILDEWHHKDFYQMLMPEIGDETIVASYEQMKSLAKESEEPIPDFESFAGLFGQGINQNETVNQQASEEFSPGSYETWQQIAKVIVTGNTDYYQPTLEPNTHWKHWPESGSM